MRAPLTCRDGSWRLRLVNAPSPRNERPRVTIVIPVYNEESILETSIEELVGQLQGFDWSYEIILAENGSTDRTVSIAETLEQRHAQIRHLSAGEPNYGKALREGILRARGEYVLCDEIDLCDTDFYRRAMDLLEPRQADLVIGSKAMRGANDERPWLRRAGTLVINGMLRVALDFHGTDTHGLKAFRREPLRPIVNACLVDKDLFASEMVIRAERAGLALREIPVHVREKREPSTHLLRRVPNVLRNLGKLVVAIRIRG